MYLVENGTSEWHVKKLHIIWLAFLTKCSLGILCSCVLSSWVFQFNSSWNQWKLETCTYVLELGTVLRSLFDLMFVFQGTQFGNWRKLLPFGLLDGLWRSWNEKKGCTPSNWATPPASKSFGSFKSEGVKTTCQ